MAGPGSRLEKFGTVFSRVTGLLKSGALKPHEKPLWYDVYAAHPPHVEPTMTRPLPTQQPYDIVYVEDVIRVKFYEKYGNSGGIIDLIDETTESSCQRFINKYMELEKTAPEKGPIFQVVEDALKSEGLNLVTVEEQRRSREASVQGKTISEVIASEKGTGNLNVDESSNSSSSSSSSSSSDEESNSNTMSEEDNKR